MKDRCRLKRHLMALGVLCAGYVMTRYIFFDLHGMKQWPLVLFLCALAVIGLSMLLGGKMVPIDTALAYILGFALGAVFQKAGFDPGGGSTNNLWVIWTVVFVCFTLAAVLGEVFGALLAKIRDKE